MTIINVAVMREARLRLGISQAELASRLGLRAHTVYTWESGRQVPSVKHLLALAAALGLKPGELLNEQNENRVV